MKKTGSTTAKVGAWIGLTICAFVFWCGLGALALLDDMDAYTLSESELTDQLYQNVIERYSLEAVGLTYQGKDAVERFSDTYYRFGIIEADDISDVDLRDKKSYDVENFGDALDNNAELNVISYDNISSQTNFWYADNLFDDYGYGDTVYAYGESYYYSFSGGAIETTTVAATSEEDGTAGIAEESGDAKKNDTSKGKTYKVVSVIPQNVTDMGLFSDDMFVQAHTLVVWAYRLRYSVFLILLAVFLIAIWLFVFLMCSAGHRKNQEGIVLTLADKISTDVFVVAVIALEFMLFLAMDFIISVQPHPSWPILLAALAAVVYLMCYLALFALLSIAVRVKSGTIWKNSWIYRIGRQLGARLRGTGGSYVAAVESAGTVRYLCCGRVVYHCGKLWIYGQWSNAAVAFEKSGALSWHRVVCATDGLPPQGRRAACRRRSAVSGRYQPALSGIPRAWRELKPHR